MSLCGDARGALFGAVDVPSILFNVFVLSEIIRLLHSLFISPELGSKGFPLPIIDSVHFVDSQLTTAKVSDSHP